MKWLNIEIEHLRGPEYLGADTEERATWLSLMAFCAAQENYGVIEGCSGWKCRKWQQICGVTKDEAGMKSELYSYDGDDLHVHFYPVAQQAAVKSKRENGKLGGRPKKVKELEPLKTNENKPHGSVSPNLDETLIVRVIESVSVNGIEKNSPEFDLEGDSQKAKKSWNPDPIQTRLNALYGRRDTTEWSDKEKKAYRKIDMHEEDLNLIERFCHPTTGASYRRQALTTLINNWTTDVERARCWKQQQGKDQTTQQPKTGRDQVSELRAEGFSWTNGVWMDRAGNRKPGADPNNQFQLSQKIS